MREKEREREREVLIGKTYIQQIRDESIQNTCVVFEYYLSSCVMKQNRKTRSFFHQKRGQFRHHFFLFFFSRMNVLKFAKINVGGWKQYTHDA